MLLLTNLGTGIIVARTLGPSVLGVWMILGILPSYAEAFGRLKVDVASVYIIGKGEFKSESVLFILNVIALLSSGLMVALIIWKLYE